MAKPKTNLVVTVVAKVVVNAELDARGIKEFARKLKDIEAGLIEEDIKVALEDSVEPDNVKVKVTTTVEQV